MVSPEFGPELICGELAMVGTAVMQGTPEAPLRLLDRPPNPILATAVAVELTSAV
jgi:hypothetical protein